MPYPWIDDYLLQKPGVTKDLQPDWNWIRYQIGGKLFAAVCLDDQDQPRATSSAGSMKTSCPATT